MSFEIKAQHWNLGQRLVHVVKTQSGVWRVRIRWSLRLGLQHPHVFRSQEEAEKFVAQITQLKQIRAKHWITRMDPTDGWELGWA